MKLPNTIRSPYNYKPIPIIPIHKKRPYSKSHCPTQHSTHTRSRIFPTVTTNITKQIISPNLNLALYTVPSNFTAYLTYNPPLQTPNTYQLTRELSLVLLLASTLYMVCIVHRINSVVYLILFPVPL